MDEDVGAGVGPSERAHDAGGGGSTPERRRRMSRAASRTPCCGCYGVRIWNCCRASSG